MNLSVDGSVWSLYKHVQSSTSFIGIYLCLNSKHIRRLLPISRKTGVLLMPKVWFLGGLRRLLLTDYAANTSPAIRRIWIVVIMLLLLMQKRFCSKATSAVKKHI